MTAVDWARVDVAQVTAVQDDRGDAWSRIGRDCYSAAGESLLLTLRSLDAGWTITAWRDASMQWHQLAVRGESGRWYPVDGATLPPMREGDA